jgi:hypothetical protein
MEGHSDIQTASSSDSCCGQTSGHQRTHFPWAVQSPHMHSSSLWPFNEPLHLVPAYACFQAPAKGGAHGVCCIRSCWLSPTACPSVSLISALLLREWLSGFLWALDSNRVLTIKNSQDKFKAPMHWQALKTSLLNHLILRFVYESFLIRHST